MSRALSGHERSYRALVLLYPRGFRREYGGEMVLTFRDDTRSRGAAAAWRRALADLVLSLPVQRLEAIVTQASAIRAAQAALAVSALLVLTVVAMGRYVVVATPIAIATAGLALLYLRAQLPYREAVTSAGASWWRLLAAGAGLLAGIALVANFGPDVDWFPWHLAVLLFLAGWALMIAGVIAGLVRLATHLRQRPAASI